MSNILLEMKSAINTNGGWSKLKPVLLEGLEGNKLRTTEIMLENALNDNQFGLRMLLENAALGSTSAGNIALLPKVILPVIRRVAPSVIANEIMGVQAMSGPLSYIRTLRFRYAQTIGTPNAVSAGSEAFNPTDIAKFYSGNANSTNPAGANLADLEGTGGPAMNMQIVNQSVEAKTRKLRASWSFEAAQDAQSQAGIDIEAELMALLAQEITAEIDQEMLFKLRNLATVGPVFDQSTVSGTPTFVGDEHAALATLMNLQSVLIAQRTRQGPANWAVVSPTTLAILQSATTSAFARTTEGVFEAPTNVKMVGTLNSSMKVYSDTYADASTGVLVGYKGSDINAAAYYCPYVPLMSTPIVIDPNTFQPNVSFLTRYGYAELTNTASSLGNSADFLSLIGINSATLRFQ